MEPRGEGVPWARAEAVPSEAVLRVPFNSASKSPSCWDAARLFQAAPQVAGGKRERSLRAAQRQPAAKRQRSVCASQPRGAEPPRPDQPDPPVPPLRSWLAGFCRLSLM